MKMTTINSFNPMKVTPDLVNDNIVRYIEDNYLDVIKNINKQIYENSLKGESLIEVNFNSITNVDEIRKIKVYYQIKGFKIFNSYNPKTIKLSSVED